MNLKYLKKLKGLSIVIIPTTGGTETKSVHFTIGKSLTITGSYTIIILLIGFFVLNLTPLKSVFFPGNNTLNPSEKKIINELNKKLNFLSDELESLKSTNQQLKDAIMLGDTTLYDSLSKKLIKTGNQKKRPFSGDIFFAFKKLFSENQKENNKTDQNTIHFMMPVNGFISRGFSPETGHMGIDIVVKTGTPVYAAAGGYVIFADYTVRDGYMIIIGHPNGYITVYKHCSALLKKSRDVVLEGEMIALSGNSGEITTGPHLHFEIWKNGKPINPKNLLINY